MAFVMGRDCINVAREAMMGIGCIQAQVCPTNRDSTGMATPSKWLQNGMVIPLKSNRLAQYFKTFRKEFLAPIHIAGYEHRCQFTIKDIQVNVDDDYLSSDLRPSYGHEKTKAPLGSMYLLNECSYLGVK